MRLALSLTLFCAPLGAFAQDAAADRLKTLEDRLDKLEATPAKTSLSAFNPAMGMAIDTAYQQTHDRGNALLRAAEIHLEAPTDPYVKGWIVVNARPGEVGLEEAALETTSLPHSLTVRAGRLFADFGRLGHVHNHELPVIDRPNSLETFIGGESQADGVETSYLLPFQTYTSLTLGMYNKIGAENAAAPNDVARGLNHFTYLGRLTSTVELGDDHSVDLGVTSAWTPRRTVTEDLSVSVSGNVEGEVTKKNTWRTLHGVDLTYRWQPASGGLYKGLLWGTEVFQNNDRRFGLNVDGDNLPIDRVKSWAGYTFVQLKLGRHWRPGAMFDLTEDLGQGRRNTKTATAFLTYYATEFQRLRATYARVTDTAAGTKRNDVFGLQWTAVFGHHVHGFRDR